MVRKWAGALALVWSVSSCSMWGANGGGPPQKRARPRVAEAPSSPQPSSTTTPNVGSSERAHAEENEKRLIEIRDEAVALATQDGPETAKLADEAQRCRGQQRCFKRGQQLEDPIARHVVMAILMSHVPNLKHGGEVKVRYLNDADSKVAAAEKQLARAKEAAKEQRAKIAQQHAELEKERPAQEVAAKECSANLALCKKRCGEGTPAYCTAFGIELADLTPPKFNDAVEALQKACDAGWKTGCMFRDGVQRDAEVYEQEASSMWAKIESTVDDISIKKHMAALATKLPGKRNARAAERMRLHTDASVTEVYCPAATAFRAKFGQAEFGGRSRAHCDDRPPHGTGLSGADVTLTTECRSVYATQCPR